MTPTQEVLCCRFKLQGTLVDDSVALRLPRGISALRWTVSFGQYTIPCRSAPWPQCRLPRLVRSQDVNNLRMVRESPMVLGPAMPDIFLAYYVPRMMLELVGGGFGMSDSLITLMATLEYRVVLILAWQVRRASFILTVFFQVLMRVSFYRMSGICSARKTATRYSSCWGIALRLARSFF